MNTWQLWRVLEQPPIESAIFQRTLEQCAPPQREIPLMTLNIPLRTLLLALNVGGRIAREREKATYDLLRVTPPGGLAAHWAIFTGHLYYNKYHEKADPLMNWISIGFVAGTMLGLALSSNANEPALVTLVIVLTLTAGLFIHDVQATLLAGLLGMLTPMYTRTSGEARAWAGSLLLTLLLTTYAAVALLGLLLLPAFSRLLAIGEQVTELVYPCVLLMTAYALPELFISSLWRTLLRRTDAQPGDLAALTGQ